MEQRPSAAAAPARRARRAIYSGRRARCDSRRADSVNVTVPTSTHWPLAVVRNPVKGNNLRDSSWRTFASPFKTYFRFYKHN